MVATFVAVVVLEVNSVNAYAYFNWVELLSFYSRSCRWIAKDEVVLGVASGDEGIGQSAVEFGCHWRFVALKSVKCAS